MEKPIESFHQDEAVVVKLDGLQEGNFRVETAKTAGGVGENVSEAPSEEYSVDVKEGKVVRVAYYSRYTNDAGGHSAADAEYYYPKGEERKHIEAKVGNLEELFPNGLPERLSEVATVLKDKLGTEAVLEISE